jgi:hypothetical protein
LMGFEESFLCEVERGNWSKVGEEKSLRWARDLESELLRYLYRVGLEPRSLSQVQHIRICSSKCNKENNMYDLCGPRRSLCDIDNEDHQTRHSASVSQSPRPGHRLMNFRGTHIV